MALSSQFVTGQQSVTASALALNSGTATNFQNGVKVTCLSSSTVSVFLGKSTVTTGTGDELPPGQSVVLPIQDISSIYVIAASAAATVSWLGLY